MSTPRIKFEDSPTESLADSFVSTPGTQYPSLFPTNESVNDCMTPQSYDDDSMFGGSVGGSMAGTPAPEKKPIKKRKSWGQQLPEPKTNLPPRKRAKTEDEKEQRRVERVLRNRRAAQSSRERKRQEVEALENEKKAIERQNQDLQMRLSEAEARNMALLSELQKFTGDMKVFHGSSATASPHQSPKPVTFSKDLFGSREEDERSPMSAQVSPLDTKPTRTVNPASLSPEIRPVAEPSNASSSDMTQHPAVSVGRTAALDGFNASHNFNDLSTLSSNPTHQYDFGSFFDAPEPALSNHLLSDSGFLPITDNFDLNFDHLAYDNDSALDDFNINEYLHDENNQPATEGQSSDSVAESTASLQPQFGASTYGCDVGGNAVTV